MPLKFDPETHQYELDGKRLVSVTQALQGVGLINFDGISPDVLQRAADFGTAVHLATALDDMGDLDEQSLDQNLWPYLMAWRYFRRDELALSKFDEIEQPIFHQTYQFAGTPDRIAIARNIICDIKTSTTVPSWTGLQLAGYSILADLPTARRIAVQLLPTGKYVVHEFTSRQDRGVFLSCLAIYNWKINHAN